MTTLATPLSAAPRRDAAARAVTQVLAGTVLGVALPALLLYNTRDSGLSRAWVGNILIMTVAGWALARLIAGGLQNLYNITFWVFVYVWMGLWPTVQIRIDTFPGTTPGIIQQFLTPATIAICVGTAAKIGGSWLANQRPAARVRAAARISRGRTLLLVAATLIFVVYTTSRVGLTTYFNSREALALARNVAWGDTAVVAVVSGASLALPLVAVHSLVGLRRQNRAANKAPGYIVLLVAMVGVLLMTVNVISSSRIAFGTMLLSLAVAAGLFSTKQRTRGMIIALLFGLVVVFPVADTFRYENQRFVTQLNASDLAGKGDYDAYAQMVNTITYVHNKGLTNGRQAIGVVTFWVPRSIWPNKPTDTGIMLANYRGYPSVNISEPLWGEAYINWGWPSLILGMGAVGYALTRGDQRIRRTLDAGRAIGTTDAILPFFMIIVLRGSLLQATAGLTVLAFTSWWTHERRPPPVVAATEGARTEG